MIVSTKLGISSRDKYSRCVTAERSNVNHARAEFDERSALHKVLKKSRFKKDVLPFYRDIKVCDIVEDEIDQRFVFFFSKEIDK